MTESSGRSRFLEREADRLPRQANTEIAATAALQADRELRKSIPGVGAVTAQAIRAELPEPARFDVSLERCIPRRWSQRHNRLGPTQAFDLHFDLVERTVKRLNGIRQSAHSAGRQTLLA